MKAQNIIEGIDFTNFDATAHNPSYASLTNNFENVHQLKDYCIPVNAYFPPPLIMEALYRNIPYALKYYPSSNESISNDIAIFSDIANPNWICAGNGSTEIISWLNSIFIKESLFVPIPSFGRWIDEPKSLGIKVHTLQYQDETDQFLSRAELVYQVRKSKAKNLVICNPNNPTGSIFSRDDILWILAQLSHLENIVIDESFMDFAGVNPPSVKNDVASYSNAWVIKSLGKNIGLHGLRMGFAVSCEENIKKLRARLPYWNVNGVSEMLLRFIRNEHEEYVESLKKTEIDTHYLSISMESIPELNVFPSHANFVFVKLDDDIDGTQLRDRLLKNHGCFVRNCSNKLGSNKQYFRIATRSHYDVDHLVRALKIEIAMLRVMTKLADLETTK